MAMSAEDIELPEESAIEKRNMLLEGIAPETVRKAWFTLSHLLLDEGSKIIDMGCGDGAMTYTMAVLNPKLKFVGVDQSKRLINKAKQTYDLHNLEFQSGDVSSDIFEPESLDAIISSFVLHEVFSGSRYNPQIVNDTLRIHFKMLKKGGVMFLRDFARPPPEEFVMLEMPDKPGTGEDLPNLSEADLLMWYSAHARPRQDPGCGGFFLEELPPKFPNTRLFRLPYKWAYEFIMRKDDRAHWEKELPVEYTFFTPREFRRALRSLGARVQYAGPHSDEDFIEKNFEGKFKLYQDDGTPLGNPPTSYLAVATKMTERKSLRIEERRPSSSEESKLKISAMRNQQTGELVDIVSRDVEPSEIIPYRVDEEGRLKVYLHDGVARSIGNAVPRGGINIDGRRWSGHMVEQISVDGEAISTIEEFDVKHSTRFARDYLGLKPKDNAILEHGPDYYPSPDYIDERIHTFYLNVEPARGPLTPKSFTGYAGKFLARGMVREMDAQQILNAISVGMIPNARLEMQILVLFEKLKIKPENWSSKQITFKAGQIKQKTSLKKVLKMYGMDEKRFNDIKGTAGQLRAIHSVFVEEGQARGSAAGLSAQSVDFVVHNDQTINTAIVLPLTKGLKEDVHAGFHLKHMPVPQRHEGKGATIAAPSFNLPPDVTNLKLAKKFIAEKYGVLPSMVIKMGESYYSHIGVTPHKIYPFAVIVPEGVPDDPETQFLPFYQFMLLRRSLAKDPHLMTLVARAYKYLNEEIRFDFERRVGAIVKERFDKIQNDWALPLSYEPSPIAPTERVINTEGLDKEKLDKKIKEHQETHTTQATEAPAQVAEEKSDFEEELEEFIEVLEKQAPKPEKW